MPKRKFLNPSLDECEEMTKDMKPISVTLNGISYDVKNNVDLAACVIDKALQLQPTCLSEILEEWRNLLSTVQATRYPKKLQCGLYLRNDTQTHFIRHMCFHIWTTICGFSKNQIKFKYMSKTTSIQKSLLVGKKV